MKTKGALVLIPGLEMAGIVPPFGFKLRMGKMILRKRKGPPWKSLLEVLRAKIRTYNGDE